jgi:hypothetical protein
MTQVFLTIGFVLSLSFITLAASFADTPATAAQAIVATHE